MRTTALAMLVIVCTTVVARAEEPASRPATQPAANISPEARQLMDQIAEAYGKLHALNLAGTLSVQTQLQSSTPQNHAADLTSSFVAPNFFRHEVKGDVLIGSTGQKLYTFQSEDNAYTLADAARERVASKDLPKELSGLLGMQDPSLLLAISKNPGEELASDVTQASKIEDAAIGDTHCPTLRLVQSDQSIIEIMADPRTHLLRRATIDLTAPLKQRRAELARVTVSIDYVKVTINDPASDESFAWSAPPGAKDADAMASARPLDDVQASELEGKAAPDFKLNGMDDKPVALTDLKGKVVIIDFWATWCGPCRASLPHLDELYKAKKEKGLVVFALDEQEQKDAVDQFIKQTGLTVPVLLDSEGKVGAQYGVTGIPQTVVIGKDGVIKKIIVGFDAEETPGKLQKAVDAAMQ